MNKTQAYISFIPSDPASPKPNFLASSFLARFTKAPNQPRSTSVILLMAPVTGPVARFACQISGHGYIVAAPSSYHEFTNYEPLAYDGPGTDAGNEFKVRKVCSSSRPFNSLRDTKANQWSYRTETLGL